MKTALLKPLFVESIPEVIDEGVLYVSMIFATAMHRCACGCGEEVVTPLSPTDWQVHYDGENISLEPSIGNWGFRCRSHYWVRGGEIRWSGSMSKEEIQGGRSRDRRRKSRFYGRTLHSAEPIPVIVASAGGERQTTTSLFGRLKRLLRWGTTD